MFNYPYSIIQNFSEKIVSINTLKNEILAAGLYQFSTIDILEDAVSIYFTEELLEEQFNILNTVISNHRCDENTTGVCRTILSPDVLEIIKPINLEAVSVALQIDGTWSGSFIVEGSINGTSWFELEILGKNSNIGSGKITTNSECFLITTNLTKIKLKAITAITGLVEISITSSKNSTNSKNVRRVNDDDIPLTSVEPRVGNELVVCTHNFCDKTTWFGDSIRVTDYICSSSLDGTTFQLPQTNLINLASGKLFDEDAICADVTHGYAITVTIGENTLIERDHFETAGGDFFVNHASGTITLINQTANAITASYSYATTSTWYLIPDPGTAIDIETCEAQFSSNVILRDTIQFDIYGYNPYDLPNKILYKSTGYKTMRNMIDEAIGSYPVIPAIGGDEGRGITYPVYGFPFRYGTIRKMISSQGIELRIHLKNDKVFAGEHATATFYCTVKEE
jgi:hypothetical protein